jgi:hypothetical protein
VLQDNPKTLNAGISHPKRGLPIVITRSGKDILNFTNAFNQFSEAGQALRGESARCETAHSRTASVHPPSRKVCLLVYRSDRVCRIFT